MVDWVLDLKLAGTLSNVSLTLCQSESVSEMEKRHEHCRKRLPVDSAELSPKLQWRRVLGFNEFFCLLVAPWKPSVNSTRDELKRESKGDALWVYAGNMFTCFSSFSSHLSPLFRCSVKKRKKKTKISLKFPSVCPVGGRLCWSLSLTHWPVLRWLLQPRSCSHSDPAPPGQS